MNNTDKFEFLKVLNGLATVRSHKISSDALDLWWACMSDWSIEDFKAGAILLLKTATFMPTPKDFEDLRKAGRPTAGEAFAGMRQWLKYSPYGYALKDETPPEIASAIHALGGADAYAMCDMDKLHFLEKRFSEHYNQLVARQEIRNAVPEITLDAESRAKLAGAVRRIEKGEKLDS